MNLWFVLAGICSLLVCLLHIFGGGKTIARPLLNSKDLGNVAKYSNYYCWHMVTIVLAAMGAMFIWAAMHHEGVELAFVGSVFAGAFTLWSLGIVYISKGKLLHYPQWLLFAPIAVSGLIGLMYA